MSTDEPDRIVINTHELAEAIVESYEAAYDREHADDDEELLRRRAQETRAQFRRHDLLHRLSGGPQWAVTAIAHPGVRDAEPDCEECLGLAGDAVDLAKKTGAAEATRTGGEHEATVGRVLTLVDAPLDFDLTQTEEDHALLRWLTLERQNLYGEEHTRAIVRAKKDMAKRDHARLREALRAAVRSVLMARRGF